MRLKITVTIQNKGDLRKFIDSIIVEINTELVYVIKETEKSDIQAKKHNSKPFERHRLYVLIDNAISAKNSLSTSIQFNLDLLTELISILYVVKKWKNKPIWKDIEPCLVNSNYFTHTILMLYLADYFESENNKVEIIPTERGKTPDFKVCPVELSDRFLQVEFYQPYSLQWKNETIPKDKLDKIVGNIMNKAKIQFNKRKPGILAVGGYNQEPGVIDYILRQVNEKMNKKERLYLTGILFVNFEINKIYGIDMSYQPSINLRYIPNIKYFGSIDVITPPDPIYSYDIEKINLPLIENISNKVIFTINKKMNLFDGSGNIELHCGKCDFILAKNIWKQSLQNVVVKCPSCNSYNQIIIKNYDVEMKGWIKILKGVYELTDIIHFDSSKMLFGEI